MVYVYYKCNLLHSCSNVQICNFSTNSTITNHEHQDNTTNKVTGYRLDFKSSIPGKRKLKCVELYLTFLYDMDFKHRSFNFTFITFVTKARFRNSFNRFQIPINQFYWNLPVELQTHNFSSSFPHTFNVHFSPNLFFKQLTVNCWSNALLRKPMFITKVAKAHQRALPYPEQIPSVSNVLILPNNHLLCHPGVSNAISQPSGSYFHNTVLRYPC